MSRRIEIELTSARDDGSWTWRAAGAREPRGVLDGTLLPAGSSAGDVLRADVETSLDGTTVLAVLPPKGPRTEPDRIELVGAADPEQWVTTVLAPGRPRRDDRDRRDRRDRKEGGRPPRQGREGRDGARRADGRSRPDRREGSPREGTKDQDRGRPERTRTPRPPVDTRPKPKRLRARNTHRKAVLADLPPEHQPVAEQVLKGGIPAVRAAVAKQNEQARAEGKPEVKADQLVDLAEKLLPRLRAAEWRDRAEAAVADLDELDLRDLRSVIVAAEGAARDDESRALAASLREGLARRVDEEQSAWLREIASTLTEGRVVRALRLSSRPPKAGDPLPADLATRLIDATNAALSGDTAPDRWATVLDALSFSPVHLRVEPASVPAEPNETLLTAVRSCAARVPQIAARFGIDPATTAPPPRRRGGPQRPRRPEKGQGRGSRPERKGETQAPKRVPAPPPHPGAATAAQPEESPADAPEAAAPTPEAETPAPEDAALPAEAPEGEAEAPTPEPEPPAPVAERAESEAPAPVVADPAPATDARPEPDSVAAPEAQQADAEPTAPEDAALPADVPAAGAATPAPEEPAPPAGAPAPVAEAEAPTPEPEPEPPTAEADAPAPVAEEQAPAPVPEPGTPEAEPTPVEPEEPPAGS